MDKAQDYAALLEIGKTTNTQLLELSTGKESKAEQFVNGSVITTNKIICS